jgi:prepilin-type N-terminal cleavage/methylation domain-containing protein
MAFGLPSDGDVNVVHVIRARLTQSRPGVSLLEVIVTLAVLGVLTAVVGLSWQRQQAAAHTASAAATVAAARRKALDLGTSVTVRVELDDGVHVITVTPDGRIRGGEALGFDPLAGRPLPRSSGLEAPDTPQRATIQLNSKE